MKRRWLWWTLAAVGVIGSVAAVPFVIAALDPYRRPPAPPGMIARFTTLGTGGLAWGSRSVLPLGCGGSVLVVHTLTEPDDGDVLQVFEADRTEPVRELGEAEAGMKLLGRAVVLDAARASRRVVVAGGDWKQPHVRLFSMPDLSPISAWMPLPAGSGLLRQIENVGDWDLDGSEDFALSLGGEGARTQHVDVRSGADGTSMQRIEPLGWRLSAEWTLVTSIAAAGDFLPAADASLAVLFSAQHPAPSAGRSDALLVVPGGGGEPVHVARHDADGGAWVDVARAGDVDGDGRDDLVLLTSTGLQLVCSRDHALQPLWTSTLPIESVHMSLRASGDVDGDGVGDVVWNMSQERTLVVSARNGIVLLDDEVPWAGYSAPSERGWPAGDVDGDGFADVALVHAREDRSAYDPQLIDSLFGARSWVVIVSGARLRDAAAARAK